MKDREGGRNQYHTPRKPISVVTTDGPTPQYQAEKTTAAQSVGKGNLFQARVKASAAAGERLMQPVPLKRTALQLVCF